MINKPNYDFTWQEPLLGSEVVGRQSFPDHWFGQRVREVHKTQDDRFYRVEYAKDDGRNTEHTRVWEVVPVGTVEVKYVPITKT